ncbi:hypothetical protein PR048_031959 [Dryococelus australis]|uniref:Uncharacterized protein n=1 Tax=Dryococelus australis TaxID=614101 RepID=A0ABQ9G6R7_9NEOP|nr:hypothetical protein PR048_031959 [Dryococelus australis]
MLYRTKICFCCATNNRQSRTLHVRHLDSCSFMSQRPKQSCPVRLVQNVLGLFCLLCRSMTFNVKIWWELCQDSAKYMTTCANTLKTIFSE